MTQNVDGLHRVAGTKQLIEVHGYIFDLTCTKCHRPYSAAEMLHGYKAEVPPAAALPEVLRRRAATNCALRREPFDQGGSGTRPAGADVV